MSRHLINPGKGNDVFKTIKGKVIFEEKEFATPILVLFCICLVVSVALSLMNGLTFPIIDAAATERTIAVMNTIIPGAEGYEPIEPEGLPASVTEVYKEISGAGYIFILSVKGYGGDIRIICGIDPDGRVLHSSALSHTETKGLGTIIDEPWFTDQFDGKDHKLDGISTVTGSTISTRAYINAVRDALAAYESVQGVH